MLIGRELHYIEGWHESLKGMTVKIVAVHHGESILVDGEQVGDLREGDWLEVAPIIIGQGTQRQGWMTYDALPSHLIFQD